MGEAVKDIIENIKDCPGVKLSTNVSQVPSGQDCITLLKVSPGPGDSDCKWSLMVAHRENTEQTPASEIIAEFLASGWPEGHSLEKTELDEIVSVLSILKTHLWRQSSETESGMIEKEDEHSHFDFKVYGPKVICLEIDVPDLFVDPKMLSFEEIDGSLDHLKYYSNCAANTTTLKRMAFAATGSDEHKAHMHDNHGHKFNLHFVLTDEGGDDDLSRKYTRIIFDPKARDGGGPGG